MTYWKSNLSFAERLGIGLTFILHGEMTDGSSSLVVEWRNERGQSRYQPSLLDGTRLWQCQDWATTWNEWGGDERYRVGPYLTSRRRAERKAIRQDARLRRRSAAAFSESGVARDD